MIIAGVFLVLILLVALNLRMYSVCGNSMSPTIDNGDVVVCLK